MLHALSPSWSQGGEMRDIGRVMIDWLYVGAGDDESRL